MDINRGFLTNQVSESIFFENLTPLNTAMIRGLGPVSGCNECV